MELQNCEIQQLVPKEGQEKIEINLMKGEEIIFQKTYDLGEKLLVSFPKVQVGDQFTLNIVDVTSCQITIAAMKHGQAYFILISGENVGNLQTNPVLEMEIPYLKFKFYDHAEVIAQKKLQEEEEEQKRQEQKKMKEQWVFKAETTENENKTQQVKVQPGSQTSLVNNSISNTNVNSSKYEKVLSKLKTKGGGISDFQSSSSLQHSIPEVSFAKANRFQYKFDKQTDFNYNIPSQFEKQQFKGAGFGYGQKSIVPEYVTRNAKQNPGPESYFKDTNSNRQNISTLNRGTWSQQDRFKEQSVNYQPAPNNYELSHNFGQSKSKFTFGLKTKEIANFQSTVPSPNEYNQSIRYISQNRYSGIALGYGNKTDLATNSFTPGPGQYELPSVFKKNANQIMYLRKQYIYIYQERPLDYLEQQQIMKIIYHYTYRLQIIDAKYNYLTGVSLVYRLIIIQRTQILLIPINDNQIPFKTIHQPICNESIVSFSIDTNSQSVY